MLVHTFADQPQLGRFWRTLKPVYDYFEAHRRVPAVGIDAAGEYTLDLPAATPAQPPAG
jgi:murein L,D-transpeptidase YafK